MKPQVFIPYKNKIFEFSNLESGYVYFLKYRINLKTNAKEEFNFLSWFSELDKIKLNTKLSNNKVIHLFYEAGFLLGGSSPFTDENAILAIEFDFVDFNESELKKIDAPECAPLSTPNLNKYLDGFEWGYKKLLSGDCYQFNFTDVFKYKFKGNGEGFLSSLWSDYSNVGLFGSYTSLPSLGKTFFSNSPECLFEINEELVLSTRPIKGSWKRDYNLSVEEQFSLVKDDKKNLGELNMITDLLRNDLSSIEKPAAKIIATQVPFEVPGILHQCSKVEVSLSNDVSLLKIISSMFPGGSITGAPKKRVMGILRELEKRNRGFYCGSTIIWTKEIKSASINIRSSEIDTKNNELIYSAGGGITLMSEGIEEFDEMMLKQMSFLKFFKTLPNVASL